MRGVLERDPVLRIAKQRYSWHKAGAKKNNIPFLISFDEWWKIWKSSGHWEERGNRRGCYQMARFGDVGPYKVGNVRIITLNENQNEPALRKKRSDIAKGRKPGTFFVPSFKGKRHTKKAREKISMSNKGRVPGMGGKKHREETKRKIKRSLLKYFKSKSQERD